MGWVVHGLNPGGGEIFRTHPDTLGPTYPPKQWVPGLSEQESGRGMALTTHHHIAPRLKSRAITLLPLWAFVACSRRTSRVTTFTHFPGIQSACLMFQYHGTQSHHTPLIRTNTQHIVEFTSKLNLNTLLTGWSFN